MECIPTGRNRIFRIAVFVVALIVFVCSCTYFILRYLDYRSSLIEASVPSVTENSVSSETDSVKTVDVPVDFNKLKKVNKDIYAWIKIPAANVDYPILQSGEDKDRSFYLNHNVNGKSSVYGAIYTQNYNNKDFSDYNTVVYGHNMINGTMFGSLKKYRDKDFFNKNDEIVVYMPNRILKYKIFGAYVFDDRHILMSFDFNDENDRQLYIDTIYEHRKLSSNFNDNISLDTDDKIITLSTCTSRDSERYLVQGVLVYDSDTDS